MDKYIFPLNYQYSAKLFGIFDYKSLLPFSIYSALLLFLLSLFPIDFFLSAGIFIILALPPFLLLSTGIHNQPAIPYLLAVYHFHKNSKLYLYKNDCQIFENKV